LLAGFHVGVVSGVLRFVRKEFALGTPGRVRS
jgi:hypothetical protein